MTGRNNQIGRTRKDLLQATARLLKQGRKPTLEEVAEEAAVSRATAYRYFPGMEALLVEAAVDVAVPEPDAVFNGASSGDAVARLEQVDDALQEMIVANEVTLRIMLANSLERRAGSDGAVPVRQNRRTPLIEKALEPLRTRIKPKAFKRLAAALALIMGTESMIVFRDVLQLDDETSRDVRRWAIRALVDAAKQRIP
jgi:AcrR family transcriptional regulator